MARREVTVGDRSYPIAPFTGIKVIVVGEMLARISVAAPGILDRLAEFEREYGEKHALPVKREWRGLPQFQRLNEQGETEPMFAEADFKDGPISIPASPDWFDRAMAILPLAMPVAGKELAALFGVLVIANSEMRDSHKAGEHEERLTAIGTDLLYEGQLSELAELLMTASDVLGELDGSTRERLGKLLPKTPLGRLAAILLGKDEPTPSDAPSSSTDSPRPTGGRATKRSTKSPGKNSEPVPA